MDQPRDGIVFWGDPWCAQFARGEISRKGDRYFLWQGNTVVEIKSPMAIVRVPLDVNARGE